MQRAKGGKREGVCVGEVNLNASAAIAEVRGADE